MPEERTQLTQSHRPYGDLELRVNVIRSLIRFSGEHLKPDTVTSEG
jgi:hypothetical protein